MSSLTYFTEYDQLWVHLQCCKWHYFILVLRPSQPQLGKGEDLPLGCRWKDPLLLPQWQRRGPALGMRVEGPSPPSPVAKARTCPWDAGGRTLSSFPSGKGEDLPLGCGWKDPLLLPQWPAPRDRSSRGERASRS